MTNRRTFGIAIVGCLLVLSGLLGRPWIDAAFAQEASPAAGGTETIVVVEHNDTMTDILPNEAGPTPGALRVWGPNPLFDEANATDTGATSQGTCIAIDDRFTCMLNETILFADGSTLEIQGIQAEGSAASKRTIVGGSGRYLGATGTVDVEPTGDLKLWKKTISIVWPAG
jgi:hypothetical protein